MVPEARYGKDPSSSPETSRALSNPRSRNPWTPDDDNPNVVITVSPDGGNVYIRNVVVTRTRGVESVTVTVVDENRRRVSLIVMIKL